MFNFLPNANDDFLALAKRSDATSRNILDPVISVVITKNDYISTILYWNKQLIIEEAAQKQRRSFISVPVLIHMQLCDALQSVEQDDRSFHVPKMIFSFFTSSPSGRKTVKSLRGWSHQSSLSKFPSARQSEWIYVWLVSHGWRHQTLQTSRPRWFLKSFLQTK